MPLSYVTVDVFTTSKFAGNPLAIVHLPSSVKLTQEQKQEIAKEFNYSETVFVHEPKAGDDANTWIIDIFTPSAELSFAGHPVIGTACHVLGSIGSGDGGVVKGAFMIKAGKIGLEYDGKSHRASASIPHNIHIHAAECSHTELAKSQPRLGKYPQASPVISIVKGMTFVLIDVETVDMLGVVATTSHRVLAKRDEGWTDGFIGTYFYAKIPGSSPDGVMKLRTRMIDPSVGEDPATGSAASALCSYLAMRNGEAGKVNGFEITQGVEMGRKSDIDVKVALDSDKKVQEVRLGGSAVTVMEGKLFL